ncbi:MAG: undecaprenyldiphospho-muramoylpentapeptide beta-N-acetylglucosaminyltransferase [Eubacterium sp.]|nr:undecaprenyldiphospho-muramoylpentapeptide beta-N-acetylglucosaminyltransferase [Eubacterium sp.]
MKILIAAGGTGGHIYPGLAIADKFKEKMPEAEIVFVGSLVGMEKNIVPKEGYPLEYIRVRGFERELSLETLAAVKGIFDGMRDAKKVIARHKPDLVIGTGGFTCGPLLLQAARRGIPTMIHEQNAYPGKANRMLGKKVDRVAISFMEAAAYFPEDKIFLAGNPVREAYKHVDRADCRKKLGLAENQKMVVAMGGSQGAGSINEAVIQYMVKHKDNPEIVVYHLTGRGQYEKVIGVLKEKGVELKDGVNALGNIHIVDYSNEVDLLLGAGDLVISRSGAMSIAEIAAVGIPSILIPYPMAAGNHQEFNARVLTDQGGGVLILDKDLTPALLEAEADAILGDAPRRQSMAEITKKAAIYDADLRFYEEALKVMK